MLLQIFMIANISQLLNRYFVFLSLHQKVKKKGIFKLH